MAPKIAMIAKDQKYGYTWSKSIRRSLPTPDLKSIDVAWLPTPRPITTTYD